MNQWIGLCVFIAITYLILWGYRHIRQLIKWMKPKPAPIIIHRVDDHLMQSGITALYSNGNARSIALAKELEKTHND